MRPGLSSLNGDACPGSASIRRIADEALPVQIAAQAKTTLFRKDRSRERAHFLARGIAQVRQPEEILDRAQQREVVVRVLVGASALDERGQQQRANLAPAFSICTRISGSAFASYSAVIVTGAPLSVFGRFPYVTFTAAL